MVVGIDTFYYPNKQGWTARQNVMPTVISLFFSICKFYSGLLEMELWDIKL